MGAPQNRLKKRREAIKKIEELFSQANTVNVIHYSCESFYDRTDGRSPRITSIAVKNLDSAQTSSFSIHQIAERHNWRLDQIEAHYDELEKEMLEEFYAFVQRHTNFRWMHWNMRDINYGFPAIAHRFSVLGGKPTLIDDNRLFDMARILVAKYGPSYAGHPRLERLMALNHISAKDALPGAEEAKAFENKEYVKLHQSTLRKVDVISNIAEREWNGTLKTNHSWRQQYGTSISGIIEAATDSVPFKVLGLVTIVVTLIAFAIQLLQLARS
jgi:hypothetical protein